MIRQEFMQEVISKDASLDSEIAAKSSAGLFSSWENTTGQLWALLRVLMASQKVSWLRPEMIAVVSRYMPPSASASCLPAVLEVALGISAFPQTTLRIEPFFLLDFTRSFKLQRQSKDPRESAAQTRKTASAHLGSRCCQKSNFTRSSFRLYTYWTLCRFKFSFSVKMM